MFQTCASVEEPSYGPTAATNKLLGRRLSFPIVPTTYNKRGLHFGEEMTEFLYTHTLAWHTVWWTAEFRMIIMMDAVLYYFLGIFIVPPLTFLLK